MRYLLAALAMTTAFPVAGFAADLPYRKGPPIYTPPPPIFTWTGFYIGGYAGGVFRHTELNLPGLSQRTLNSSDITGGGLIGYNYQFNQIVVGVEGEFGYNGVDEKRGISSFGSFREQADYIGRARGRVGYAWNNALLYAAGGASFTDQKGSIYFPNGDLAQTLNKDLVGWNVGGGVEYAFTPNWIGRAEYIYDDFGKNTYTFSKLDGLEARVHSVQNTARVALEYKF